jgi:hypothetical protein
MLTTKSFNNSQRDESVPIFLLLYSILAILVLATLYFFFSENSLLLKDKYVSTYLHLENQQSILDALVPNILLTNIISFIPPALIPVLLIKILPFLTLFLLTAILLISFNFRIINPSFSLYFFQLLAMVLAINLKIDLIMLVNYFFYLLIILFTYIIIVKLGKFFWLLSILLLVFGIPAFILGLLVLRTLLSIFSRNSLPSYLKTKYIILSIITILASLLFIEGYTILFILAILLYKLLTFLKIEIKFYLVSILFLFFISTQAVTTQDLNSAQVFASNQAIGKITAGKNVKFVENIALGKESSVESRVNLSLSNVAICNKPTCLSWDYALEIISYEDLVISDLYAYYPTLPGYFYRLEKNEK